jgi:transposase InsO family protein
MVKFPPPPNFNFSKPEDWPNWARRYRRFRSANDIAGLEGEVQVDQLLYCMGDEAEVIFSNLTVRTDAGVVNPLTNAQKKEFGTVMTAFEQYFMPKVNHVDFRIEFNSRTQKDSESIEEYVRELHKLVEFCEYPDKDNMMRDRFVTGVTDKQLEKELRLKGNTLTLSEAISIARNWERVNNRMTGASASTSSDGKSQVDAINKSKRPSQGGRRGRGGKSTARGDRSQSGATGANSKCENCGMVHKDGWSCPAKGKKCLKCHKFGHFRAACRAQGVKELTTQEEGYFLGALNTVQSDEGPWMAKLPIQDTIVQFKVDSGADVSVISEQTYKMIKPKPALEPTRDVLKSVSGKVPCMGTFMTETKLPSGQRYKFRIYVIPKGSNLLSRAIAKQMNIIQFNEVNELKIDEDVFSEVGLMKTEPVIIKMREGAVPFNLPVARRVSLPMVPLVEKEIQRMERNGIIRRITKPTEWCSPMVATMKKCGHEVRICVDLKHLNKDVEREKYIIPAVQDMIAKLSGSVKFTSLDAAGAYLQMPLSEESQELTTFLTPLGRFCFTRVPYGITSASEIFQRKVTEILDGVSNVVIYQDDILVFGKTDEEHDQTLVKVIAKLKESGLRLNKKKCCFGQRSLKFLGHHISKDGVRPDEDKVKAIVNLEPPEDITSLRRVIGMIQYLGQYLPNLSTVMKPLNDLLRNDSAWIWDSEQERAFNTVKKMVSEAPCLAYYDLNRKTVISADASSYGIGGLIMQYDEAGKLRPVAFVSRTLSNAEKNYAQIEKECLASVWTCEKFSRYLVGLNSFTLLTDHKPLVPLIGEKPLDQVPIRCQRLLMRMMRFNPVPKYVPGKDLIVADALSRQPLKVSDKVHVDDLVEEVAIYVDSVVSQWPATDAKLEQIRHATCDDLKLSMTMQFVAKGWPRYSSDVPDELQDMFEQRAHLSIVDGLLVYDDRIVIPSCMQEEILSRIHEGHPGIVKSRERAKQSVWWKGLSGQISDTIERCSFCQNKKPTQRKEPLVTSSLPDGPWQRLGVDLCEFKKQNYLVVMDYHSRYIEIAHLPQITSNTVIQKMKGIFGRWGIPNCVMSDNGTQFASTEFAAFADYYGFNHVTSSPGYPQSNGEAERGVQIAKSILSQGDPFIALMTYRDTPIYATGKSPNEIMLGRKIRTRLPCLTRKLQLSSDAQKEIKQSDDVAKQKYKHYYDTRHGVRDLPQLTPGNQVRIKLDGEKQWSKMGTVVQKLDTPRSYVVETEAGGSVRRNRRHLQSIPNPECTPTPVVRNETSESRPLPRDPGLDQFTGTPSLSNSPIRDKPETPVRRSRRTIIPPKRLIVEA